MGGYNYEGSFLFKVECVEPIYHSRLLLFWNNEFPSGVHS